MVLKVHDGLLAKEDEELPLSGHVLGTFQQIDFVEYFVTEGFVWPEEIIVSNPEGKIVAGTFKVVKAISLAVGRFICAVEPLNELLERPVLF